MSLNEELGIYIADFNLLRSCYYCSFHHYDVSYILFYFQFWRGKYMEGIFKQATDERYSDLLNRQKLSSELDLKRQHVNEVNKVPSE